MVGDPKRLADAEAGTSPLGGIAIRRIPRDPEIIVGAFVGIGMIGAGPDQPRLRGVPVGRPTHPLPACERNVTRAVGPHDVDLQHVFFEAIGPIGDEAAIGGKERAAVVAGLVCELADVAAIGSHHVDVGVAVAIADEEDLAAVRRKGALGVVAGLMRELNEAAACGRLAAIAVGCRETGREDVGLWIKVPLISPPSTRFTVLLGLRPRRGLRGVEVWIEMARRKEQLRAVGGEPAAGCPPAAGADPNRHRRPRRHGVEGLHEDLIERIIVGHRLIADLPGIGSKISLARFRHAAGDLHRCGQESPLTWRLRAGRRAARARIGGEDCPRQESAGQKRPRQESFGQQAGQPPKKWIEGFVHAAQYMRRQAETDRQQDQERNQQETLTA